MDLHFILLVAALVSFFIAAIQVKAAINLVNLGLMFGAIAALLGTSGATLVLLALAAIAFGIGAFGLIVRPWLNWQAIGLTLWTVVVLFT